MRLLAELKRRNVIRMAGLYIVGAWLILQVAETLLPIFETPAWVLKALVVLLAIGFFPALVFSWIFELTPEGLKRDADIDPAQSVAPRTARRMDQLTLAGVLLLLAAIAADRYWPRQSAAIDTGAASVAPKAVGTARTAGLVAVLPFRNRSERSEDAFFAEGIHDDLLTQLSKVASLRVISRTSMMRYRDTQKSVPEIAAELGAAVVLEGAVQRSGDQVRINVQLIDGGSDEHLWAETYDRELTADNLFAIQADIARVVTQALQVVLTPAEAATLAAGSTSNVRAYEAFLQGKLLSEYDRLSDKRYTRAIAMLDQAIALDPQFADAYARKARAQLGIYWYSPGHRDMREAAAESLQAARRLAPESTETWMAQAYDDYWGNRDYAAAEAVLARVLARSPEHVEAWLARAFVARRDGRIDDSVAAFERALQIDPVNIEALMDFSQVLSVIGEHDRADALLQTAARLGADTLWNGIEVKLRRGDVEAAWALVESSHSDRGRNQPFRAALLSRDRQRIERALSPDLWPPELHSPTGFSEAHALAEAEASLVLGETAQARTALLAIQARLDQQEVPYPGGWSANAWYYPCLLPGMLGDLEGVQAAERDYVENAPRDVWASIDIHFELAIAYARAADPERAMELLEALAKLANPAIYLRASIEPGLDSLHQHPRWLALKQSFEQWQQQRAP
ncbi:MAG: tetratricopeptide repeat protein [Lysobacterales bacterium]